MSASLGLQVLSADYTGQRIPVMEHPRGASREVIRHFTDMDPIGQPHRLNDAFRGLAQALEIDLLWGSGLPLRASTAADSTSALGSDEIFDWSDGQRVKKTHGGHDVVQWGIFGALHQEDGRHFVHVPRPVSVTDALDFDPLEYFPHTVEQYHAQFQAEYADMLNSCGNTCLPLPHHYTTCFHWALAVFGFELLCEAGMEERPFHALMERFAEISRRITTGWSLVAGLKGFILHDDLTMTSGPLFAPSWYREHIFCHYPSIFAPFMAAGIPIIFTSDGDCTAFVDDIFAAGADGLNFEYLVDLEWLVERHPDKLLIGNINSGTIAHADAATIARETCRCIEIGRRAPRFVVNIGGGITHDMSATALEAYLQVRKSLCRTARAGLMTA